MNYGEAVAIGMVAAGQIAVDLKLWGQDCTDRQLALTEKAGLPSFVLPTQTGVATVTDQVPADVIRDVVRQMQTS